MRPLLVGGNGKAALRRAAEFGDGWVSIGLSPAEVADKREQLDSLAEGYGGPIPAATVVGPALDSDLGKAGEQLAAYAEAGTERLILAPTGAGWQRDYELAAKLQALR